MAVKSYSLTLKDWQNELSCLGHSKDSASLMMNLTYRSRHKSIRHFSQLSPKVQEHFESSFDHALPKVIKRQKALDGTVKLLLEFEDSQSVEAVLLPFYKKYTLCVSSQVGCAMNCAFCFTATQGFKRNLKACEIIGQVLSAKDELKKMGEKRELANIVFMGQGEPLHNFNELKKAIEILTQPQGLGLGRRSITVSTSGYLPGLKRFSELGQVNLAFSLHSADDAIRSELIPINRRFKLDDVMQAIDEIKLHERQTVEYEYLLIKELNDGPEDAQKLYELLKERTHMVNIIPFNPFPGSRYQRPAPEDVERFKSELVSLGLRVMVRKTKGDDILAACGQLKS